MLLLAVGRVLVLSARQFTHKEFCMNVFVSSALLVVASVFITFSLISLSLFHDGLSLAWGSPTLLVEVVLVAGILLLALAVKKMVSIHKALSGLGAC